MVGGILHDAVGIGEFADVAVALNCGASQLGYGLQHLAVRGAQTRSGSQLSNPIWPPVSPVHHDWHQEHLCDANLLKHNFDAGGAVRAGRPTRHVPSTAGLTQANMSSVSIAEPWK